MLNDLTPFTELIENDDTKEISIEALKSILGIKSFKTLVD